MRHFRSLKQQAYDELKARLVRAGEIDRLIKTASLFLAMCRLLQDYTQLRLPFTYDEFLEIAIDKIRFQVELIGKTDKLATFFKAMDVMIDTKAVKEGRDFAISAPDTLTVTVAGREKKSLTVPSGTRVLFIRLSSVYSLYARSSYNLEETSQSTIEQNLRSHPSYLGFISGRRFTWYEAVETPRGGFAEGGMVNNEMVRRMEKKEANSSCIALNYDIFMELYGIDLQRDPEKHDAESGQQPPLENPEQHQKLPF